MLLQYLETHLSLGFCSPPFLCILSEIKKHFRPTSHSQPCPTLSFTNKAQLEHCKFCSLILESYMLVEVEHVMHGSLNHLTWGDELEEVNTLKLVKEFRNINEMNHEPSAQVPT